MSKRKKGRKGRKIPDKKSDKKNPHRFNFGQWYSLAALVLPLLHDLVAASSIDIANLHLTITTIF